MSALVHLVTGKIPFGDSNMVLVTQGGGLVMWAVGLVTVLFCYRAGRALAIDPRCNAEFNLVFTVWAKWTTTQNPHSEPIQCWLQAFLLFLRIGGHKAHSVQQADFIGCALYKFRTLSMKLLKFSWMHSEQL